MRSIADPSFDLLDDRFTERLNELEIAFLRGVGNSVDFLQKRCLRLLAPSIGLNIPRGMTAKSKEENTPLAHRERSDSVDGTNKTNRPPKTNRSRRQVSLMRPKLIGKSVEGAAVHAVAASRRRASSNQFKNAAGGTPAKRPPVPKLARQSSRTGEVPSATKSVTNRPPRKDQDELDEELVMVKQDFTMLCSTGSFQMRRLSSLHSTAVLKLATVWWPIKDKETIPKAVAEFLFQQAAFAWSDSRPFPPIPQGTNKLFIPLIARYMAALNPGLQIVPIKLNPRARKEYDSILLSSEVKNVRGCKVLVAVLLSRVKMNGKDIIRSEGAVLNLPRRSQSAQLRKGGWSLRNSMFTEKDAAGMAKLGYELHVSYIRFSITLMSKIIQEVSHYRNLLNCEISNVCLLIVTSLISADPWWNAL